jgi:O-acetyl-ADP-ribose deacetylase (regulator of RNase III)
MPHPKVKFSVQWGDITTQNVDAIVNAANTSLLGGAGVDGAIHAAAGPQLREACAVLKGCRIGEAKITRGFRLNAQYVIHAVGPMWQGGTHQEDDMLGSAYRRAYDLVKEYRLHSVAFPALSTGVFGFPIDRATRIARIVTDRMLRDPDTITEVRFICHTSGIVRIYEEVFKDLL